MSAIDATCVDCGAMLHGDLQYKNSDGFVLCRSCYEKYHFLGETAGLLSNPRDYSGWGAPSVSSSSVNNKCCKCNKETERFYAIDNRFYCHDCFYNVVESLRRKVLNYDEVDVLVSNMTEKVDKSDKLDWTLVPWKPMESVVRQLMAGAKKHSPFGWQGNSNAKSEYLQSLLRQIHQYMNGDFFDDSGESRLAAVICNALFLMWHNDND